MCGFLIVCVCVCVLIVCVCVLIVCVGGGGNVSKPTLVSGVWLVFGVVYVKTPIHVSKFACAKC